MKDAECPSANYTTTQTCEVTNLKQTGFRHTNDDRNKIVKGVFRIKSASSTMLQHSNHLVYIGSLEEGATEDAIWAHVADIGV